MPDPGGAVTVTSDDESTLTAVPRFSPKRTNTVPTKLLPQIVTVVPPFVGPRVGVTSVIVGGATKVYLAAVVAWLEPPRVETVT